MSLLSSRGRVPESLVSDLVRERVQDLTGTPLQRCFLIEDALIRRDPDPDSSTISFSLKRTDTSTGNFQVRENCQTLLKVKWESKGIQGILNLLGRTISLEEEISVEREHRENLTQLSEENSRLRKEVSLLRNRLQETEKLILS